MIYSDYSTHPREINQRAVDESQTLERLKSLRKVLYGDGPGDPNAFLQIVRSTHFRWPDRTGRKIHQRDLCMSLTVITEERNIANALISGLANMAETPTREQVEEKARQIAAIFGYTGDLRNIVTEAMISVDTRMGPVFRWWMSLRSMTISGSTSVRMSPGRMRNPMETFFSRKVGHRRWSSR